MSGCFSMRQWREFFKSVLRQLMLAGDALIAATVLLRRKNVV